jgi:transketolase
MTYKEMTPVEQKLEEMTLAEKDPARKARLVKALSSRFRLEIFDILHEKQTGHWGGASSACDLVTALYFHRLRVDPKQPRSPDRDRFVLSKGHASMMLYTVLAHRGYFDPELLSTFRSVDSTLQGHPCMNKTPGVDMSTGALGHGLSVATGMALGARLSGRTYQTWVMVGEGCLNEGQSWEAIMTAAKYKPEGLTLMVDYNGVQLDGASKDIMPLDPLADKFKAFGWNVMPRVYDGHDTADIFKSFGDLDRASGWPKAAIYRTNKGSGVSFMEGKSVWHGSPIDEESFAKARPELRAALSAAIAAAMSAAANSEVH